MRQGDQSQSAVAVERRVFNKPPRKHHTFVGAVGVSHKSFCVPVSAVSQVSDALAAIEKTYPAIHVLADFRQGTAKGGDRIDSCDRTRSAWSG